MGLRRFTEDRKRQFMENVSDAALELLAKGEPITTAPWGNSYDRQILLPLLTDKAFLDLVTYCYEQSSFRELPEFKLPSDYNDACVSRLLPMLLQRFCKLLESLPTQAGCP